MPEFVVYKVDGTKERVSIDKKVELESLQKLVGGYIERTFCHINGKKHKAYVNEEGLLQELQRNPHFYQFVGDVVVQYDKNHVMPDMPVHSMEV